MAFGIFTSPLSRIGKYSHYSPRFQRIIVKYSILKTWKASEVRCNNWLNFFKRLWGSEPRWARGAQYVAAKSVFKMAGRFSPVGVGVKLSSFVVQIPKFACMVLCSQRLLPRLRLYGGTKIVWFCMFNSKEQAIVCKGTVKNTWSLVLSYFLSIFSFKRLFCGHYSYDILMFWEKQYLRKKPMFLVCWNLQVGADIYAFYNRVVLSCLTGCLSKLWNSCEWWQQTLAGEDQRPFRRKI